MPDEIDLLRWFRADTPEPDDAAWNRAQTALADARSVERAEPDTPRQRHRSRWRPPGRRVTITAVAGIVAVAAAALVAVVAQAPPTLTGRLTTSWQPARLLPGSGHAVRAPSGTWRLMSYLVASGWQENTAGPEPGWLTCPTAATCYVEGDNSTSPSGPADMDSFYVSTDGAQTWNVLPVPDHVTFTSALSCASATDCAAGGLYYGRQPVYLTTANGGHSWTVSPLQADVGQIIDLECATTMTCRGLASASGQLASQGFDLMSDMQFVATADGGRHFTVVPFPKSELIESVTCPTASHCVAVGFHSNFTPRTGPDLDHGVLLTSDDGGMTWRRRAWPNGYGPGPAPDVTCVDASHCAMIGFVEHNGKVVSPGIGYTSGKDAVQYTVIGFSSDGGASWTKRTLPHSMPYPMIEALTCPTTRNCYAAGSDNIEQRIGSTRNAASSVVAITNDAGRTWQRVTFAAPATVPGGMQGDSFMDIGQIQCPQPDACIGIGDSDQGSTATPIYTNHG
jgi:photosystem II stability/assembly factor-like uncharacterized protein